MIQSKLLYCKLCDYSSKQLHQHLKAVHHITCLEYRSMFNGDLAMQINFRLKPLNVKLLSLLAICGICGIEKKSITEHIKRVHNITLQLYRKTFTVLLGYRIGGNRGGVSTLKTIDNGLRYSNVLLVEILNNCNIDITVGRGGTHAFYHKYPKLYLSINDCTADITKLLNMTLSLKINFIKYLKSKDDYLCKCKSKYSKDGYCRKCKPTFPTKLWFYRKYPNGTVLEYLLILKKAVSNTSNSNNSYSAVSQKLFKLILLQLNNNYDKCYFALLNTLYNVCLTKELYIMTGHSIYFLDFVLKRNNIIYNILFDGLY